MRHDHMTDHVRAHTSLAPSRWPCATRCPRLPARPRGAHGYAAERGPRRGSRRRGSRDAARRRAALLRSRRLKRTQQRSCPPSARARMRTTAPCRRTRSRRSATSTRRAFVRARRGRRAPFGQTRAHFIGLHAQRAHAARAHAARGRACRRLPPGGRQPARRCAHRARRKQSVVRQSCATLSRRDALTPAAPAARAQARSRRRLRT